MPNPNQSASFHHTRSSWYYVFSLCSQSAFFCTLRPTSLLPHLLLPTRCTPPLNLNQFILPAHLFSLPVPQCLAACPMLAFLNLNLLPFFTCSSAVLPQNWYFHRFLNDFCCALLSPAWNNHLLCKVIARRCRQVPVPYFKTICMTRFSLFLAIPVKAVFHTNSSSIPCSRTFLANISEHRK